MPGLDNQAPMGARAPLPRAVGYALLAAGLAGAFLSALIASVLFGSGGSEEDAQGYSLTRLVVFLGLPWVALAWVLWRAGRIRLLASIVGLAVLGFSLSAFVLGDLDAGGSADSKSDVGLVIGSAGALAGLFVSWGGARLLWPSTSPAGPGQNLPPSQEGE
jgi:apolipoprotein N-acyltransferase